MRNLLFTALTIACLGSPSLSAVRKYAPMPDMVFKAKTVYLDDQSGYPGAGDKAFQELTKWGRFKVVSDRKGADLILLLSTREYTGGYMTNSSGQVYSSGGGAYGNATSIGVPLRVVYGYLTFIDPSNGEMVWSEAKRASWGTGHTVHAMFDELRKRFAEQESTDAKK